MKYCDKHNKEYQEVCRFCEQEFELPLISRENLIDLRRNRNRLIKDLWIVCKKLYDTEGFEKFSDEDLRLWTAVTNHSGLKGGQNV